MTQGPRDPLAPRSEDDRHTANLREDALSRREGAIHALGMLGYTVKLTRGKKYMIITCRHDENFKQQIGITFPDFQDDHDRWFHLVERIRAMHIRRCGKEF